MKNTPVSLLMAFLWATVCGHGLTVILMKARLKTDFSAAKELSFVNKLVGHTLASGLKAR
jgi:hypothetical protein